MFSPLDFLSSSVHVAETRCTNVTQDGRKNTHREVCEKPNLGRLRLERNQPVHDQSYILLRVTNMRSGVTCDIASLHSVFTLLAGTEVDRGL